MKDCAKKTVTHLLDLIEAKSNFENTLTDEIAIALVEKFRTQYHSANKAAAAENGRGSYNYWIDHGKVTGCLMQKLARENGKDERIYKNVGIIHDLDYLMHPHDEPHAKGCRHPVPLVMALLDSEIDPRIGLAIMEHAPYVGRHDNPSSPLSAALSACEDLATLISIRGLVDDLGRLSSAARKLRDSLSIAEQPLEFIERQSMLRVENDIDKFINIPLEIFLAGKNFMLNI